MEEIICKNCGTTMSKDASFCSKCGAKNEPVEEVPIPIQPPVQNVANNTSQPQLLNSKHGDKILLIIIALILAILCSVVTGVCVRSIDNKVLKTGKVTLGLLSTKLNKTKNELEDAQKTLDQVTAQVEAQKKEIKPLEEFYDKSLAMGTYTVVVDLEPGIYHLMYKLRNPDGYNWGDYIYVTNANSDGANKTLGGTKYDTRVEASEDGEVISIKLASGDTVVVDTNYGNWTPASGDVQISDDDSTEE